MSNTLGVYNPKFYANEALIALEKALGLAGRVFRGFDEERKGFQKGETVNIRRPSSFSAADAPSSAQDLDTGTVTVTLDKWREVKFSLTDKELAFTADRIIEDHIRPAAYAIADDIDQKLAALYADIPWYVDLSGTPTVGDVTDVRKILFDNGVPLGDDESIHYMIDGALESGFLGLTAFSQYQGAGDDAVKTQLRGSIGKKFGTEVFANQNTPSHTKGTCSTADLLLNGGGSAVAKGTTTINLDAVSVTGTLVAGDTFVIAGNTQRYSVTALNTAATNAFTGVTITPALVQEYADDAATTVSLDDHVSNLMFHRNAFALVMAPLSDMGNELGAKVATVADPKTGVIVRSRIYYIGASSKVDVALDVLYGIKTLDPNLACRGRG